MKKSIVFSIFFVLFISTSFAQIKIRPISSSGSSSAACCGFRAYNSTEIPMGASFGKENTLVFDKEIFDDGNAFNGAAYKAPSDGVYQFTLNLGIKVTSSANDIEQLMVKIKTSTQSNTQLINISPKYDNVLTAQVNIIFKLTAGEEVSVVIVNMGGAKAATTGNLSYFSGVKLY